MGLFSVESFGMGLPRTRCARPAQFMLTFAPEQLRTPTLRVENSCMVSNARYALVLS